MEASPTNSKEETPTASHNLDEPGEKLKDLTFDVLHGVCNEEMINFEDDGLFTIFH